MKEVRVESGLIMNQCRYHLRKCDARSRDLFRGPLEEPVQRCLEFPKHGTSELSSFAAASSFSIRNIDLKRFQFQAPLSVSPHSSAALIPEKAADNNSSDVSRIMSTLGSNCSQDGQAIHGGLAIVSCYTRSLQSGPVANRHANKKAVYPPVPMQH